jgi:hypothetical protein
MVKFFTKNDIITSPPTHSLLRLIYREVQRGKA